MGPGPIAVPAVRIALALTLLSLASARKLELRTSLGELLPDGKESVIVAQRVNQRLPSVSSLVVVATGKDNEGLKRFVDALGATVHRALVGPVPGLDDGAPPTAPARSARLRSASHSR